MRVGSAPENAACYPSRGAKQAEDGQSRGALAGAGLVDQAQNLALVDVQVDASDAWAELKWISRLQMWRSGAVEPV